MNRDYSINRKDVAFAAITDYIEEKGWVIIANGKTDNFSNILQYIDPVTGCSHRSDFAFIIQCQREDDEFRIGLINRLTT